ncbi:hypothetical protein [Candidatus Methylacidiphilum fumarolicum]|uniref:Transposase IS200-like domain-containing protein n=1 Tax=Candidatus Methylacidiphilum fumarolicum TaxID=591154 RepID=A0ABN8XFU7_9BACT|nr:hypothetical protein [Candidatus Methylacidiphilum fumarolicum]CAI9085933.1 protein of unknown function [Candidatus Methylacidiphilum fumarolicum]
MAALSARLSLRMDTKILTQNPLRRGGGSLQGSDRQMLAVARLPAASFGKGRRPWASLRIGPASLSDFSDRGTPQELHVLRGSRKRFPKLKNIGYRREHLRTQSYYVGTAGTVSAEVTRRFIAERQGK